MQIPGGYDYEGVNDYKVRKRLIHFDRFRNVFHSTFQASLLLRKWEIIRCYKLIYIMKKDKYYWLNRASKHHIDRLRNLISDLPDGDEILRKGIPRYIYHVVDEVESVDGHRLYQFLIEYDIYNPTQGIYFGCKSITRKVKTLFGT